MRGVIIAVAALALGACVHTDTTMLTPNTAIISGRGSAFANNADVTKKLLVEAATIGQERGFSHFAILGMQDASSQSTFYQPGSSHTTGSAFGSCMGNFCSAHGSSTTTTDPGYAIPIHKPGADATVRYFHEQEVQPGMSVWRIADILSQQE